MFQVSGFKFQERVRKRKKGRKLSRKRDQRKALVKSLASALFLYEKIKTTEAKAKEIAPFAERSITRAKEGGIHARRMLGRTFSPVLVKKIVEDIAPRYQERKGGYTRIVKLEPRKRDGAKMAIIELLR